MKASLELRSSPTRGNVDTLIAERRLLAVEGVSRHEAAHGAALAGQERQVVVVPEHRRRQAAALVADDGELDEEGELGAGVVERHLHLLAVSRRREAVAHL